ncbi:phosphodiesterase [Tessaracoccus sp. OH4464_COT-324]|nr:phosphodiesterase [Tessaracoccus sp. OH4464_COT-324]
MLAEVADCGFYPAVVVDALNGAVGRRRVLGHLVHHEATFATNEVHRHLTVLALVEGAFIICHADEAGDGRAVVTTELVKLRAIDSVIMTRSVADAASSRAGLAEAWLTVIWGAARRVDVQPAGCDEPGCEADHGYTGMSTADDYVLRMSRDADGDQAVGKLVEFGALLQGAVQ